MRRGRRIQIGIVRSAIGRELLLVAATPRRRKCWRRLVACWATPAWAGRKDASRAAHSDRNRSLRDWAWASAGSCDAPSQKVLATPRRLLGHSGLGWPERCVEGGAFPLR